MRIISGKYKGRRINPPKNLPVRPTTDMSKESIFNVLNNHFDFSEAKVLDLFAGTGNISFEFCSRGCENVTAVDQDFGCIKFIKQTASEFDFRIAAIKSAASSFLEKNATAYDIIFADPPYHLDQSSIDKIVLSVFNKNLLNKEGMMIVEHSKRTSMEHLPNYSFRKNYGGSVFSFFEFEAEENTIE